MTTTHKNAPGTEQGAEGEDQNPTHKEETPIVNDIIADTTDDSQTLEQLRPIYGPSDERWEPLLAWLVEHAAQLNRGHGADPQEFIESMRPTERAGWHSGRVLGVERDWAVDIAYPVMPETEGPSWATSHDDGDVSIDDGTHSFPVRNWAYDFDLPDGGRGSLGQLEYFNPETGEITRDPIEVTVSLAGQDEMLTFQSAEDARTAVECLRMAATLFASAVVLEAAREDES